MRAKIRTVPVIPLFDLKRQHAQLKKQILKNWEAIYEQNSFTSGKETTIFEREFANLCQTKHSLAVHSGTDSLIISLKAAGLKSGDEVITTPCTFSASADCIVHVGATPVFVDVLPKTGNIDPQKILEKISPRTKAILIVHLYGVPCQMDEILKICRQHRLTLIEDASHAHGSLYHNKPVGSFGLAGCFSLYPSKSLGSLGNAGIITSNNSTFIKKAHMYANHGIKEMASKYTHHFSGFNKLIDNIQSAALIVKLPKLPKVISKKRAIAEQYNQAFSEIGLSGMFWPEDTLPSLYVYAWQVKERSKVAKHFAENGVNTGVYYPIPLHLQPSMKKFGYKKGDLPNAEKFFNQTLSIPLFPELTTEEISRIVSTIKKIKAT